MRLTCLHIRPGPRCVLELATPDCLPAACETCEHYRGPSRGLGDVVAKVAQATGVAAVVKAVAGEGCGCGQRRAALNRAVPFKEGAD
jgi:hypothetical protein